MSDEPGFFLSSNDESVIILPGHFGQVFAATLWDENLRDPVSVAVKTVEGILIFSGWFYIAWLASRNFLSKNWSRGN